MVDFALLNYKGRKGEARPGLRVGDHVLDLEAAVKAVGKTRAGFSVGSTKEVLQGWPKAEPVLRAIANEFAKKPKGRLAKSARLLARTRLLAPITNPDGFFCAFGNFTDLMLEMAGRKPPDKRKTDPLFFMKAPHSIAGPEQPLQIPSYSKKPDWEAELAVVIGRPARHVHKKDAMKYVAGYTIVNDISLRDCSRRKDYNGRPDMFFQKSFETGGLMGPWIVPRRQIKDPHKLSIKQWVGGVLHQDSSTRCMHFTIGEQIAYLSRLFTLHPGDVISTGSPGGAGHPKGIYIKPGQDLEIEIEGIGRLHNPVVAEPPGKKLRLVRGASMH